MEMLLMGICISVLGMAVAAMAFGAATRPERTPATVEALPVKVDAPANFFAEGLPGFAAATPDPQQPKVPIEALLLQIENHVRLEQAAAESFIEYPSAALLHTKTVSTFLN